MMEVTKIVIIVNITAILVPALVTLLVQLAKEITEKEYQITVLVLTISGMLQ